MRFSGVLSGEVAPILVVAAFLVMFTAGFSLPVEGNGIEALRNFTVASNRSTDEKPEVSINATSENPCVWRWCMTICCRIRTRFLGKDPCMIVNETTVFEFPTHHNPRSLTPLPGKLPCHGGEKYHLQPKSIEDEFKLLINESLHEISFGSRLDYESFCLAAIGNHNIYEVSLCSNKSNNYDQAAPLGALDIALIVCRILSVLFLLLTFLIYSLIPELQNMHGYTLRGFICSLVVLYTVSVCSPLTRSEHFSLSVCRLIAIISHFTLSSNFFWLNVICFDIWWTFRGIRSNQGDMKQREKRKFIMYSIYVWGNATLSSGLHVFLDFDPSTSGSSRQEFRARDCWFKTSTPDNALIDAPIVIILVCNMYLFISTTIKIFRHSKNTAHYLKGTDSQRHDINKQRFMLYLKLFIVMGMSYPMGLLLSYAGVSSAYITYYIPALTISLQGVMIFILFVWKDKTKKLLLKRLGC